MFRKAAESGDREGQSWLGHAYQHGLGVAAGLHNCGEIFIAWRRRRDMLPRKTTSVFSSKNGLGVERDYAQALRWYLSAAEAGDGVAQFNWGVLFEHGLGVQQNLPKPSSVSRRRRYGPTESASGDRFALCARGGVGRDLPRPSNGIPPQRMPATLSHQRARVFLSLWLERQKDPAIAASYYRKAADLGFAEAQNNLDSSTSKARRSSGSCRGDEWYRLAAAQDYAVCAL